MKKILLCIFAVGIAIATYAWVGISTTTAKYEGTPPQWIEQEDGFGKIITVDSDWDTLIIDAKSSKPKVFTIHTIEPYDLDENGNEVWWSVARDENKVIYDIKWTITKDPEVTNNLQIMIIQLYNGAIVYNVKILKK